MQVGAALKDVKNGLKKATKSNITEVEFPDGNKYDQTED